jgi:hypothetical protein
VCTNLFGVEKMAETELTPAEKLQQRMAEYEDRELTTAEKLLLEYNDAKTVIHKYEPLTLAVKSNSADLK